jgi:hypothetical protein
MSGTVWIGLVVLLGALLLELYTPQKLTEGFQALGGALDSQPDQSATKTMESEPQKLNLITTHITRRGDVGLNREIKGYVQDRRYYAGYSDVQRYGVKNDFCRVVTLSGEEGAFFACALAGTKGTSPVEFRTKAVSQGFRLGRDDYMRDILRDGRDAYCRVLKYRDGTYQPLCRRAGDTGFLDRDEIDANPPEDIKTMIDFYTGCAMWLRLRDDMRDYIDTAIVQRAGGLSIDETPRPIVTRGLHFNGKDQFVRLGDTDELSLGNRIQMRTIRAFSMWVKFDEFTNNAHIFDFGDGPGLNNIFLGILGKGEGGDDPATLRPWSAACPESTVPPAPTGAQKVPEVTPQTFMRTTKANVNEYSCTDPEVLPRRLSPVETRPKKAEGPATRATLLYEVWDQKLRKVQIKVNRAIPLQRWTHIVVTAASMDAMRPDLHVYVNGNLLFTQQEGYLPQAKVTSNNYLGKSNWMNDLGQYELRDELFSGSLFDFRVYTAPMSEAKVKRTLQWGMGKLGLDTSFESVSG